VCSRISEPVWHTRDVRPQFDAATSIDNQPIHRSRETNADFDVQL